MDDLSFYNSLNYQYAEKYGASYPSFVSDALEECRQLLIQSIASLMPGFVSICAQALAVTALEQVSFARAY